MSEWNPPRRSRIDQQTSAEAAIRAAVDAVEQAGADVRLTDAVNLLAAALESVSDFVDDADGPRRYVRECRPHAETCGCTECT